MNLFFYLPLRASIDKNQITNIENTENKKAKIKGTGQDLPAEEVYQKKMYVKNEDGFSCLTVTPATLVYFNMY